MKQIASCDVDILFNQDSCQFLAHHWFELAAHISQKQKHYDGVVVLHGTDTLAYSAAALSYLLSPCNLPIVFTGAQKPLATLRSDARLNFISALEVAAHAPKPLQNRVMVLFHDELFLGSRVRKKSATDFAAFESPRFPILATIGSEIHYSAAIQYLPKLKAKKNLLETFKKLTPSADLPQILSVDVTPQFCGSLFNDEILKGLDAILLKLYPSGTAPTTQFGFMHFLKKAKALSAPLLCITERDEEIPSLKTYQAGRELLKEKALWCSDMTPEATFVKIWLLKEIHGSKTKKQLYHWLQNHWAKPLSDETEN